MLQVYHAPKALFYTRKVADAAAAFRAGRYTKVAQLEEPQGIDTDGALEHGYVRTNSINAQWVHNKDVTLFVMTCRSTSPGDIIVLNDVPYFVGSFGFEPLPQGEDHAPSV